MNSNNSLYNDNGDIDPFSKILGITSYPVINGSVIFLCIYLIEFYKKKDHFHFKNLLSMEECFKIII